MMLGWKFLMSILVWCMSLMSVLWFFVCFRLSCILVLL